MREIKFRWLHKKSNKIADWDTMLKECDRLSMLLPSEDWIPMQFTGLLDKNGKEIYEGDIVRIKSVGGIFNDVVEWQGSGLKLKNTTRLHSKLEDYENIEVIGNRFENPELLKESER